MDLIVMAKEPRPGRVKTRLCPPCTPGDAAWLAAAALADTLHAATSSTADRVILALDGELGPWCPPGVHVVAQGDGDLARRLTVAWEATDGPALQIGMDTPQLAPDDLDEAMRRLCEPDVDAVLGPATDGGWWGLGLRRPHADAFAGVAMSTSSTGAQQRRRLRELDLRVAALPEQRDVDTWADARAVAQSAPASRFAASVRDVAARLAA